MQAENSNLMPKCMNLGRENHAASLTSERSTMPNTAATIYPAIMPSRMAASLQMPLPLLDMTITTIRVNAATAQFCHEP